MYLNVLTVGRKDKSERNAMKNEKRGGLHLRERTNDVALREVFTDIELGALDRYVRDESAGAKKENITYIGEDGPTTTCRLRAAKLSRSLPDHLRKVRSGRAAGIVFS